MSSYAKVLLVVFILMPIACRSQTVDVGAEVLLDHHLDELQGKRVGLVMNPTARVEGTHMLDTLLARGVHITALFGPEHGFKGGHGAGETLSNGQRSIDHIPLYSLYDETRQPTQQELQQVDVLVFDMQSVGARFYTYISTLGLVLEAAAKADVPIWILDRPNPAGGINISGWMMHDDHQSFVGAYPIPMVYGMTIGELARMMVGEHWIDYEQPPQVRVIEVKGWNRSMQWPETGLPWVAPSPNLPTYEHALVYLGTVLFEGTNLSEGRGTPDPFLTIGSPTTHITDQQLQQLRNNFPAIDIQRATFTPEPIPGVAPNPDHEGEQCYGVKLHVTNYDTFKPVAFGASLLNVMLNATKDGHTTDFIELLTGIDQTKLLQQLEKQTYQDHWQQTAQAFAQKRAPYLLYD